MTKRYTVDLVGEQHYPDAATTVVGDPVFLLREPDNPHDERAIVAINAAGGTLGYVPRDSWIQRSIHEEGDEWHAEVVEHRQGGNFHQVRLAVWIDVDGEAQRSTASTHYVPAPEPPVDQSAEVCAENPPAQPHSNTVLKISGGLMVALAMVVIAKAIFPNIGS